MRAYCEADASPASRRVEGVVRRPSSRVTSRVASRARVPAHKAVAIAWLAKLRNCEMATSVPSDVHVKSYADESINGRDCKAPSQIYSRVVEAGATSAGRTHTCLLFMGVLAGVFIGIGSYLAGFIGGAIEEGFASFEELDGSLRKVANLRPIGTFIFGLYGLPLGLLAVVTYGAELFTGNCMTMTAALIEKRVSFLGYIRVLVCNWFTNLIGNLLVVGLAAGSSIIEGGARDKFVGLAKLKTQERTFAETTCAAILANILVCMAVSKAQATSSFAGKVLGTLLPGSAFVALEFEHAVANMTFIPLGMLFTKDVTVFDFLFGNLWLVSMANWIGGGVLFTGLFSLGYGTPHLMLSEWTGNRDTDKGHKGVEEASGNEQTALPQR